MRSWKQSSCLPRLRAWFSFHQVLQSFKIMDYSLLMSIHNIDHAQREPASSETWYSADTRRPAPQKALYSTAMESIQGEARRGGTMETHDQ